MINLPDRGKFGSSFGVIRQFRYDGKVRYLDERPSDLEDDYHRRIVDLLADLRVLVAEGARREYQREAQRYQNRA